MYPNGLEKAIMMRCDNDSQFRSVAIFRRLYFCKRIRVSTGYGIAVLVLGRDCTLYVPIASIQLQLQSTTLEKTAFMNSMTYALFYQI